MSVEMHRFKDSQSPPDYQYHGIGVTSETNPLAAPAWTPTIQHQQNEQSYLIKPRPYSPLDKRLRTSQVLLYVVSFIELLTTCAAGCVLAYHVNDSDSFHPAVIATMVHDTAVLLCAAVGLMAASGRSRVVMAALVVLAVGTMAQGCILVDFFRKRCVTFGTSVICYPSQEYYSLANYQALLANLGINVALTIATAGSSIVMLVMSVVTKDITP
ncbi:uncharacterized protein LOC134179761 [Corticium candelabrum]|uniref:uncharacterized protein LOC134179761 n=1 Tax=Corticium candelabrum TaxID=121492 RepID=UPI002E252EE4|nr:uncharacterized protein LOC134179761 [Corticium candelabrum]